MKKYAILLWLCSLLASCGSDLQKDHSKNLQTIALTNLAAAEPERQLIFNDLKSYVNWVKNPANGFLINESSGGYEFELSYRPHLLELLSGYNSKETLNDKKLAELLKPYSGLQYYHLRIYERERKLSDLRTGNEAVSLTEYLGFETEKKIKLVMANDTIAPALFHYENTYPHVPYLSFVLAFKDDMRAYIPKRSLLLTDFLYPGSVQILSIDNAKIINQPGYLNINEIWN